MSTHQLERRTPRPLTRRTEPRRVAAWCAAIVLVFAAAFGIGHMRRAGETVAERTPPPLPALATPVPAALGAAPAIKLAVVRRPPPAPKRSAPAKSSLPAATPVVAPVTPAVSAPVVQTPTVAQPAPEAPVSKPAPAPAPAPSPAPSHSSGGSGSGTSFESSG